jgi:hypothetical protein
METLMESHLFSGFFLYNKLDKYSVKRTFLETALFMARRLKASNRFNSSCFQRLKLPFQEMGAFVLITKLNEQHHTDSCQITK